MMRKIIKMLNNKKGFTLIELIVVIAVLGILAAVALPRIGSVTSDAKGNADAQQVRILNEALERYIAESGDENLKGEVSDGSSGTIKLDEASPTQAIDGLTTKISFEDTDYGPYLKDGVDKNLPSGAEVEFENKLFKVPTS